MRIIFTVSALHGGGAERVVVSLSKALKDLGHEVKILMIAGDECEYEVPSGVELLSIAGASKGDPLVRLKRIFKLRRFYKKNEGAYVIAFSTAINIQAIIAHAGIKGRLEVSERNDPNRCSYKGFRNLIYRLGGFLGNHFVFQTPGAMDYFSFSDAIFKRSRVIPNPLREDLPPYCENPISTTITAVGRLEAQKNYPLMLRAFREFLKKHPKYVLRIYGKGELLKSLEELTRELKIDKSVIFMGYQKNAAREVAASGLYVMSSDYEGMPNALMEAMAMGVPCISTDCPIGGPALLIKNRENGILTPVGDVKALSEAMGEVADNRELAEKIRKNARGLKDACKSDVIAKKWLEFESP